MMQKTEKSTLIISSMHRSGSSLTASILQSAGLHIGRKLMEGIDYNTKGYLENLDFYEFHKQVLQSQGIDGDGWTLQEKIYIEENFQEKAKEIIAKNSISGSWGWKEPRTTLFLDFWAELLQNAKFILIYRSPWEVVDSLYSWQDEIFQSQPELAVKSWLHYNQKIIDFYNYAANRCLLINIQTIISNQEAFIEKINQKFKTNLNNPAVNVYDPSLFNNRVSTDSHRPTIIDYYFPEAIEMYQELEARAWNPEDEIPDFSWQELIKSSPYRIWAFQDWMNLSNLENKNKILLAELEKYKNQYEQSQLELTEAKSKLIETGDELEKNVTQLDATETKLLESQKQLQNTENILEETQGKLEKLQQIETKFEQTENELATAKSQLNQTQTELRECQSKLEQTESELKKSQETEKGFIKIKSQLNQTQTELRECQSKLEETESELKKSQETQKGFMQIKSQLNQTQGELGQYQSQLHQTQEELEQSIYKLQQTESLYQKSQSQLEKTAELLEKSNLENKQTKVELGQTKQNLYESTNKLLAYKYQLHQTQEEWEKSQYDFQQTEKLIQESHSQLQQTKALLTEFQTQLHQTDEERENKQMQLQETQAVLQEVQTQWRKTEVLLQQSQSQQQNLQKELVKTKSELEKLQYQQAIVSNSKSEGKTEYKLLISEAWYAYQDNNLAEMQERLQKSLKYTESSRTEIVMDWLESFANFSQTKGIEFDSEKLTNSEEWQNLMKRTMKIQNKVLVGSDK